MMLFFKRPEVAVCLTDNFDTVGNYIRMKTLLVEVGICSRIVCCTLLLSFVMKTNIIGATERVIAVLSCGRPGTVCLKFHCQLPSGEPLVIGGVDTGLRAGKPVSNRQRNWDTDAVSQVRERCE